MPLMVTPSNSTWLETETIPPAVSSMDEASIARLDPPSRRTAGPPNSAIVHPSMETSAPDSIRTAGGAPALATSPDADSSQFRRLPRAAAPEKVKPAPGSQQVAERNFTGFGAVPAASSVPETTRDDPGSKKTETPGSMVSVAPPGTSAWPETMYGLEASLQRPVASVPAMRVEAPSSCAPRTMGPS